MKLYSQNLELKAIRSIAVASSSSMGDVVQSVSTSHRVKLSAFILSKIDESYFHYEPCKAAYKRIISIAKKRSRIVSYADLVEDPALDEEFRDILKEFRKKPVKDEEQAEQLVQNLDAYRKVRGLYYMSKEVIEALKDKKVDVDKLMEDTTAKLTNIRSETTENVIHTIGKDANALDLVDKALSVENAMLLQTGYTEFDTQNGGLPPQGVLLLAATTSGGKSTLRLNLMKNLYKLNAIDVCTVSLEMNELKETNRLLSCLTGIPFKKFVRKSLTHDEREQAKKAWRQFHKFGVKNNCKYSILCPKGGLTISQLLMMLKPYGYKVIAIDYISLLEGVDEKDQWKVLSSITRQCKIFSEETKCLVILLAQLDSDDDRIRYSKGILENVDNSWVWNYSKPEQRALHILPIRQLKARDQELFSFDLVEAFHVMQVNNPTQDEKGSDSEDKEEPKKNGKKNGRDKDDPLSEEVDMDYGTGIT